MEALIGGSIDLCYVGAGPAINAYVRSQGQVRLIAGSASGGAILVSHSARQAEDLKGKRVGTPQLGNSQDIAFRSWLRQHGLDGRDNPSHNVSVIPMPNADLFTQFRAGQLEAVWVPEPWGTKLLQEAHGHLMLDERDLWKHHRFPTTVLIARVKTLDERPEEVRAILEVHRALTESSRTDPSGFAERVNRAFARLTGSRLSEPLLRESIGRIDFTLDSMKEETAEIAEHAKFLGYLPSSDLAQFFDERLIARIRER